MPFAPLSFLRGRSPPRTNISSQDRCKLKDTLDRDFYLGFYHQKTTSGTAFFNTQAFPPHDSKHEKEITLFHPPAHYHLFQAEYFTVVAGGGTWYLWNKTFHLSKGDELVIPARAWHTFDGDSSLEEPLIIAVKYDKGYSAMEERFFRNTLGYLSDCHKAGASPSVFQLIVFFMHNQMAPGMKTPGPEWLNLWLNIVFMYVMGGIGEYVLGYSVSYPEYYKADKKGR